MDGCIKASTDKLVQKQEPVGQQEKHKQSGHQSQPYNPGSLTPADDRKKAGCPGCQTAKHDQYPIDGQHCLKPFLIDAHLPEQTRIDEVQQAKQERQCHRPPAQLCGRQIKKWTVLIF